MPILSEQGRGIYDGKIARAGGGQRCDFCDKVLGCVLNNPGTLFWIRIYTSGFQEPDQRTRKKGFVG